MGGREDRRDAGRIGRPHGARGRLSRPTIGLVAAAAAAALILTGCPSKTPSNQANQNKGAPGAAKGPAAKPNPPAAPASPTFFLPLAFDLPPAAASDLKVNPRPTTWSADVASIQDPEAIRAAYKKDGFLSEGQQVVAKEGLNLSEPKSWPEGSSVYLEWKVTYFQTADGASGIFS